MKSKSNASANLEGSSRRLRVRKSVPRKLVTRSSVLKMLAVMEKTPDKSVDLVQDFLTTGRTGRRNAMPDILGEHASTSVADLPDCLEKLNTTDPSSSQPSVSGVSSNPFSLPCSSSAPQPNQPPPTEQPPQDKDSNPKS